MTSISWVVTIWSFEYFNKGIPNGTLVPIHIHRNVQIQNLPSVFPLSYPSFSRSLLLSRWLFEDNPIENCTVPVLSAFLLFQNNMFRMLTKIHGYFDQTCPKVFWNVPKCLYFLAFSSSNETSSSGCTILEFALDETIFPTGCPTAPRTGPLPGGPPGGGCAWPAANNGRGPPDGSLETKDEN